MAEKPRDLLRFALESALPFIDDGEFKILPSRPALKKQSDDICCEVNFNGWKWNRTGENAKFELVASIRSKRLEIWRNVQPVPVKAMAGRQDGFAAARAFNDPAENEHHSWQFGNVQQNPSVVRRLINVMNQEVLPFFEHVSNFTSCAELRLAPDIWGASLVEFALARNDREKAAATAQSVIDELSPADRRTLRDLLACLAPSDFPQVYGSRHMLGFMAGAILLNELPVSIHD